MASPFLMCAVAAAAVMATLLHGCVASGVATDIAEDVAPRVIFHSRTGHETEPPRARSVNGPPFFERKYSTGWFTSPLILNTHVETAQLYQLLTQRKRTHYPGYISGHCVEYPTALVIFSILWVPNSNNWIWTLALNVDGPGLQDQLNKATAAGTKPRQIESYAFLGQGAVYYSAVLLAKERWDPETKFSAVFGVPKDGQYCCGPSSRWGALQAAGYKPLSISVTQDPVTKGLYVADVWNNRDVQYWQASLDKLPGELQSLLAALAPPLVPIFLKAYRVTYQTGGFQFFYTFIAEGDSSITSNAASIDVSRSGFELLAKTLKYPPITVTSFYLEGETDPQDPTSGDMYGAVWQGMYSHLLLNASHAPEALTQELEVQRQMF